MPDGVRIKGTDELQKVADALKEAGDKDLQKRVSKAMREVAKPLGDKVLREGAAELPRRGGLSDYVASKGKIGISNSLRGRSASVTLKLHNKGVRFGAMNQGRLRHPVYGRPLLSRKEWGWSTQSVRPGMFTRPFDAAAPEAAQEVTQAAQAALNDVARKA